MVGTRVLSSLMQGVMLFVLTLSLGPSAFGLFASVLVICGLLSAAVGFGSGTLALRLGNSPDNRRVAGSIAVLRYPAALVAGAGTFLLGILLLGIDSMALLWAAVLLGLSETAGMVVESILFGRLRSRRAQAAIVTRRAVMLAAVVAGHLLDQVYPFVIVAAAALFLGSALWLAGQVARPMPLRGVVKDSLPFWGADLLSKLQTQDVVLGSLLLAPIPAGIFAAASRITSPINILASSMMSIFTPAISSASPEERWPLFRSSLRMMTVACVGISALGPVAGWLLEAILPAEYDGVFLPIVVLCIGTGIAAVTQSLVSYLFAEDQAGLVFRTRLWAIPLSLALGVPLALWFGPSGLAAVLGLTQILQALRYGFHLRQTTH
ncbi:lipopolysaccharide biosynthesis protein [Micrococcus sp. TA1]|uniref:lipopolysaccharide biosynthesis protein n=1 Tax=Micrococcus sp. TA1 TaxID=681627 RepID=UPI001612B585|nr:hypothetical protein [Micrococcus sp. TA1]MBB5749578.1 O-antigen/teichoic acid export membrane protein [Micrococcus sp. TA1]